MSSGQANASITSDVAPTLDAARERPVAFTKAKRAQSATDDESWVDGQVAPTMNGFDTGDTRATTAVVQPVPTPMPVDETSPTLTSRMQGSSGWAPYNETAHLVPVQQPLAFNAHMSVPQVDADLSQTLQRKNPQAVAIRTANTGANGHGIAVDVTHTLDQAQGQAVAQPVAIGTDVYNGAITGDVAATPGSSVNASGPTVMQAMQVRRLTPRECERLQGFPDDYTAIPYRGKAAADGPRYKALGNSMAVPVMRWIGERIQARSSTNA